MTGVQHEIGQAQEMAEKIVTKGKLAARKKAVIDIFTETGHRIAAFLRERRVKRGHPQTNEEG